MHPAFCVRVGEKNPCPATHPFLEEWRTSGNYYCYSKQGNSGPVCSIKQGRITAPAGGQWGLNTHIAECPAASTDDGGGDDEQGALSDGATAAIVVVFLLVIAAAVGGFVYHHFYRNAASHQMGEADANQRTRSNSYVNPAYDPALTASDDGLNDAPNWGGDSEAGLAIAVLEGLHEPGAQTAAPNKQGRDRDQPQPRKRINSYEQALHEDGLPETTGDGTRQTACSTAASRQLAETSLMTDSTC